MARSRWLVLVVIAATVLMSTLAACNGDDDTDEGGDATPEATVPQAVPEATVTQTVPEATATSVPPVPTATGVVERLPTDAGSNGVGDGGAVQLKVTGINLAFEPTVLVAPPSQRFAVVFDNLDNSVAHNLAIFASEADATGGGVPIAATGIAPGPDVQTIHVPGLAAGDYFVWCQIHRGVMTATLTVR